MGRTNEAGEQEYLDFENSKWLPFDPLTFQQDVPLEYKGLPVVYERTDTWSAYAEDVNKMEPPFERYRVPLLELKKIDRDLDDICLDLAQLFPDMDQLALAIAATISNYDIISAEEFIVSNNLSSVKSVGNIKPLETENTSALRLEKIDSEREIEELKAEISKLKN